MSKRPVRFAVALGLGFVVACSQAPRSTSDGALGASARPPRDTEPAHAVSAGGGQVGTADASIEAIGPDLSVVPVAPGVWRHVSSDAVPEFGRVAANGLLVVGEESAALVDTPWTEEQTASLFVWAKRTLGMDVGHVVATHSHRDCMGGLAEAHRRGAVSYGHLLTAEFARGRGDPAPQETFTERRQVRLGGMDLELRYFGGGHTRDNIVVWIPQRKLLFGGCLVKRAGGSAGYTAEADLVAWPATVRRLQLAFPQAQVVVPGHGKPGTVAYLEYTAELAKRIADEAP